MNEPRNAGGAGAEAAAWTIAVVVGALALAASGYRSHDGDSGLYAFIVARISAWPVHRWIAPEWTENLFREHPAGLFWLPAGLATLGYPAVQAAYAVNSVYQVMGLVLVQRLAAGFTGGRESRALAWSLQVIPLAFAMRARANHEAAVLACVLAALLATERSRRALGWCLLTSLALVFLMLVKGVFVLPAFVACVLWAFVRRSDEDDPGSRRRVFLGLAVAVAAITLTAFTYEHAYRAVTGQPFAPYYLARQLGLAAIQDESAWLWLPHKVANLFWYSARLLLLALPWSFFSAALAWRWWRTRPREAGAGLATQFRGALASPRGQACLLAAGITALYLFSMSLSDRRADRYIFPAYFAVAACGTVAALERSPRVLRVARVLDRGHPYVAPALWIVLLLLHIGAGIVGVPRFKPW